MRLYRNPLRQRREGFWDICKQPIFRGFKTQRMVLARPGSFCLLSKSSKPPIFTEEKSFTALPLRGEEGFFTPIPTKNLSRKRVAAGIHRCLQHDGCPVNGCICTY